MSLEFEDTTEAIMGSAFEVYNIFGHGFFEKVYQRALQVELLRPSYSAEIEHAINCSMNYRSKARLLTGRRRK